MPGAVRSDQMATSDEKRVERERVGRRRDRRQGLGHVLVILARAISNRDDPALLKSAFEETLRRILSIRAVQLRDVAARWSTAADKMATESTVFDVPGPTARLRGVLEATFEPGRRPCEWDVQLLAEAAQLGSLVLELDRTRAQLARSDSPAITRRRPDGAAPLIGSTPAMAALRSRIERVASTDFTVLLEGA